MSKRPRFPRRKHVPGTFRSHERQTIDAGSEPQRLTLYLPAAALDQAEIQAARAGIESVQRYCEALLLREIEAEHVRDQQDDAEARRGRLDGLLAIASDPEYLAEWTASRLDRRSDETQERPRGPWLSPPTNPGGTDSTDREDENDRSSKGTDEMEAVVERPAAEVVFHHAVLLGDEPTAFLALLRRGEPIGPEVGRELMRALADLEVEHRNAGSLDRRLAYALHKIAFEGQVLVSEAWSGPSLDETTIDLLRLVQEAVDRVLSGQDIRYFSTDDPESNRSFPFGG